MFQLGVGNRPECELVKALRTAGIEDRGALRSVELKDEIFQLVDESVITFSAISAKCLSSMTGKTYLHGQKNLQSNDCEKSPGAGPLPRLTFAPEVVGSGPFQSASEERWTTAQKLTRSINSDIFVNTEVMKYGT